MWRKIAFGFLFFLAFTLAVNALSYASFDPGYGFLKLKQDAIRTGWYLPFYYSHVLISALILLTGFVQVVPMIRNRWRQAHRAMGKFYVFGVLLFAGPGAIVMSLFINRGPMVLVSFLVQSSLWFYFTGMAYRKARNRDFVAHEVWMWRSFSLALAAISLRVYIFFLSFVVDLGNPVAYGALAWLSWVPNLLLVEWQMGLFSGKASSQRQAPVS